MWILCVLSEVDLLLIICFCVWLLWLCEFDVVDVVCLISLCIGVDEGIVE